MDSSFDPVHALRISRALLRRHFIGLLLEHVSSYSSAFTEKLASIFQQPIAEVEQVLRSHQVKSNGGLLHGSNITSYRELIPREVQLRMEAESAEDMELYEFVRHNQESEVRARRSG